MLIPGEQIFRNPSSDTMLKHPTENQLAMSGKTTQAYILGLEVIYNQRGTISYKINNKTRFWHFAFKIKKNCEMYCVQAGARGRIEASYFRTNSN